MTTLADTPPPGVIAILIIITVAYLGLIAVFLRVQTAHKRDVRHDEARKQEQAEQDEQRAPDPNRFTLEWRTRVDIPERWCRQHGYRTIRSFGGYVIQRGDETPLVVTPGDTLLWDGTRITLEPRSPR